MKQLVQMRQLAQICQDVNLDKAVFLSLLSALLLSIISCGYRPVHGEVPGGGNKISVSLASNETAWPGLAVPLTSAVRKKLAQIGLNIVRENKSAPKLKITVLKVSSKPGMLREANGRLIPLDNIQEIQARALIQDLSGDIVRTQRFLVHGRALSGDNVLSEEVLKKRKAKDLIDKLAVQIVQTLFIDL